MAAPTGSEARHISIYVDVNAPGPGDGTPANPFPTFAQAFALAIPHDYVIVRPGIYHEIVDIPFFLLVRSEAGPERTVIDATGIPGTHAVILSTLAEFTGFTITKGDGGGVRIDTPLATPEFGRILRGNRIVDCANAGLELTGPNHSIITDCVMARNGGSGVRLSGGASPFFTGNTITQNAIGMDFSGNTPDAQAAFANSILWGNTIEAQAANPAWFIACDLGDPSLATANGSFSIDPLFRNPALLDLRLLSSSACLDAANFNYVPFSSTFDNRGYGWLRKSQSAPGSGQFADIGAFERGGLDAWPRQLTTSDTLTLEIDTGPGSEWFLFSGDLNGNPSFPIPSATGFVFLEQNPLTLQLHGVQGSSGRSECVFPLVPGLAGVSTWLQVLGIDYSSVPPAFSLTNAESITIE